MGWIGRGAAVLGLALAALPAWAGSAGWRLELPGRPPLLLAKLGSEARPLASAAQVSAWAGLKVRWLSGELLVLGGPPGPEGRLLLGSRELRAGGRRWTLPGPLELAQGAPALDPASLGLVLRALGAREASWREAAPAELAAAAQPSPAPPAPAPPAASRAAVASPTAARIQKGPVRTVVIDAGHGGHDPGASGHGGLREKDACLDIALRLRAALRARHPGLRVLLTRDRDVFLSLRERTEVANRADADLFVSIHNNASPGRSARGTQTFFFDSQTSDRAAADLVMRENEKAEPLEVLMTDLAKSLVRDQSIALASRVQERLCEALGLPNHHLSYAPFYVLARTKMPAILVEVAYITNPGEERSLASRDFRQKVAEGLARGLDDKLDGLAALRP